MLYFYLLSFIFNKPGKFNKQETSMVFAHRCAFGHLESRLPNTKSGMGDTDRKYFKTQSQGKRTGTKA